MRSSLPLKQRDEISTKSFIDIRIIFFKEIILVQIFKMKIFYSKELVVRQILTFSHFQSSYNYYSEAVKYGIK